MPSPRAASGSPRRSAPTLEAVAVGDQRRCFTNGRALPLLLQQLRLDALELPVEPLRLRGVFGRGSGEAAIAASRQPGRPYPLNRRQPLPLPRLIGIDFRFEFFI